MEDPIEEFAEADDDENYEEDIEQVQNQDDNDEEEEDINAEFNTEDGEEVVEQDNDMEESDGNDEEFNNSDEEPEIHQHEVINDEEVELAQEDVHDVVEKEEDGYVDDNEEEVEERNSEINDDEEDVESPTEQSPSPMENKADSNQTSPHEEANDSNSDDDFDNVVEVEEVKQDGVGETEIVSDDGEEKGEHENEEKLGEVSDDDLRGASDSEDEGVSPSKRRRILSDEEDDNTNNNEEDRKTSDAVMKMFDSDSDNEEKEEGEEGVGELIADIFGESDEEEEFTGFGQEEVPKGKPQIEESSSEDEAALDIVRGKTKKPKDDYKKARADSDDDDEGVRHQMSDFDIMMAEKKAQTSRRRKHRDGGSLISDADDQINAMLGLMKEAAEADRLSNQKRQPALKKMKILPRIMTQLKKQDLREAFVDNGLIVCIADWLSPLPDRSLPHLSIRTDFLTCLHGMPPIGPQTLKHSGIGRAVMYLYKHPKEIRKNKDLAGRLINKWSRPIFGINENYKCLSREERELRDLEQMPQAKRRRLSAGKPEHEPKTNAEQDQLSLRPGEEGFVLRARVPMPSTRDYVVRPKSRIELDPGTIIKDRKKKKDERLDKHIKNFAERKKRSKITRAVKISLEGNKMGV